MNIYQLFTDNRREWWVKASSSGRAVAFAEHLAKSSVVCWLIGNTPPEASKVYNA